MNRSVALCAILATIVACDTREEERTAMEPQRAEEPPAVARGAGNVSNAAVASPKGRSQAADLAAQPKLALDPDGLRWFLPPGGSARPLAFGMAQADVLASLEPVRGEAAVGTNADCGAGPVEYATWTDGLSLVFKDGRFVGWGIDGRARGAIATADGIGIGTTRAELDDAIGPPLIVRQSTIGTEFTAGAYHGLFSGRDAAAAITDMWAGVSCVAR